MISEVDSVLTTGEILELIQVRKLYAYHLWTLTFTY
jgi:iron only hydrogenase large subunit-like protein